MRKIRYLQCVRHAILEEARSVEQAARNRITDPAEALRGPSLTGATIRPRAAFHLGITATFVAANTRRPSGSNASASTE